MVFSSIPVYLDPPNWHQQQDHPLGGGENPPQLPPLPPPLYVGSGGDGSGGSGPAGSIRSTADRARLAKMAPPETALKCPRCDSINTKFCYYNNYSLSQPRHFCKTCRRYWTRGGALRNVPVGGGCRRNKKSTKTSRSKSPVSAENHQMRQTAGSNSNPTRLVNHLPQPQSMPFLESIQNLGRYGAGGMGLNSFNEIQQAQHMGSTFHHGNNLMNLSGGLGMDQWRNNLQQIPFLGNNYESSSSAGLYPFQSNGDNNISEGVDQDSQLRDVTGSRVSTPPVKVEDHNHGGGGRGLTRPFLGMSENNNSNNSCNGNNQQFWGGNAWTDLSGALNSSSTSHLL